MLEFLQFLFHEFDIGLKREKASVGEVLVCDGRERWSEP